MSLVLSLHKNQGGSGRHKCVVCAYQEGVKFGGTSNAGAFIAFLDQRKIVPPVSVLEKYNIELPACIRGNFAPTQMLKGLPVDQSQPGRHRCAVCAYVAGVRHGLQLRTEEAKATGIADAQRDIDTERRAQGIPVDDAPDSEGARRLALHARYERSAKNRAHALEIHGRRCLACGFSFDDAYGEDLAQGFIEVHHNESLAKGGERQVDPGKDLSPLCANCHRMAHRRKDRILTVEEIKARVAKQRGA